jgi:hypothetical protein
MTNNFDLYKEYITNDFNNSLLDDGDMYFVVELMRRGKDNPDMPAANYHFKNYYIRKPEDLDRYKSEIIMLCDMLRLRAYVSVNYKSFRQVTLDTLAELARRVANNDYKKNYNVYESCSGQYCHSQNKRWVIDIDDETSIDSDKVKKIEDIINLCQPINKNKIITKIPTKSGVHIITTPFDRAQFALSCTDNLENGINDMPDIKKNHLTLLYENL